MARKSGEIVMPATKFKPPEEHFSLKMRRALKRALALPPAEQAKLMLEAGIIKRSELADVAARLAAPPRRRRRKAA